MSLMVHSMDPAYVSVRSKGVINSYETNGLTPHRKQLVAFAIAANFKEDDLEGSNSEGQTLRGSHSATSFRS